MRLVLTALLCLTLQAAWVETKSGPFIVYSDAGDDQTRAALYHLEQFRFIFGEALGKRDLKCVWPITIVVRKPGKVAETPYLGFSRDGWLGTWPAGSAPPPSWFQQLALLFLEDNLTYRMPGDLEPTFATLYSTLEIKGGRVVVGAPPAAAQRTRTWAMLQYLLTNPETAVRTRVLLSNLAAGADEITAFRNAYEKPKSAIDKEVDAYFAKGDFPTITLPGRPLAPERAFSLIPMLASRLRVLPADQLMARGAPDAEILAAYEAAQKERPGPLGYEGIGLIRGRSTQSPIKPLPDDAKRALEAMAADEEHAGTRGLALLGLLERAQKQNPAWHEIYVQLAAKETGPIRRAFHLKKAAELAPRLPEIWRDLAKAQFDAKQFPEAERSWRAAERVARNDQEREQLKTAREQFEQIRYDLEAAERARRKKEEVDEIERVRRESLDAIRRAEEAGNAGKATGAKAEKWWDGPPTTAFLGTLESVACQGSTFRLSARDREGKPASFVIKDPGKVVILGAGQTQVQLSCGPQRPPRKVKIEYTQTREVVTVEFQ